MVNIYHIDATQIILLEALPPNSGAQSVWNMSLEITDASHGFFQLGMTNTKMPRWEEDSDEGACARCFICTDSSGWLETLNDWMLIPKEDNFRDTEIVTYVFNEGAQVISCKEIWNHCMLITVVLNILFETQQCCIHYNYTILYTIIILHYYKACLHFE